MHRFAAAIAAGLALAACGGENADDTQISLGGTAPPTEEERYIASAESSASLDSIAQSFVQLALAIGEHDPAFVDAYHGPEEWADEAKAQARSLEQLEMEAQGLLISVARANADGETVRGAMLEKLIRAALTRIEMTQGEAFSFDEETRRLYDTVAPEYSIAEFDAARAEIEKLLPGDEPLHERVEAFRNSLAIPSDRLRAVFDAAIKECRARTLSHYDLPADERFELEFVNDKPWSGYNWYQGDFESLIQVNTDLPIVIDRAVDLGCHEGYPGHHTWNVMLERDLLNDKGWIEYSVYPLFSPLSVIAEGSANYGIDLAFPGEEKISFERDVLFPLAGLDPAKAELLAKVNEQRDKLAQSRNHVAREYLDGKINREEAIEMIMKYLLEGRDRAEQTVRFIETYRGYVLNYELGRDLVAGFVERNSNETTSRWDAFETLLTTPLAASDIAP